MIKQKRTDLELIKTIDTDDPRLDAYIHLKAFGRLIHRHLKSIMSKNNINITEADLVYLLRLGLEPVTPTQITKRMAMTKQAVSRWIEKLERSGLVKRNMNPVNKRMTIIRLTPKGRRHADKIVAKERQISHEVMSPLNEQEIQAFDQTIKKLRYYFLMEVLTKDYIQDDLPP